MWVGLCWGQSLSFWVGRLMFLLVRNRPLALLCLNGIYQGSCAGKVCWPRATGEEDGKGAVVVMETRAAVEGGTI